MVPLALEAETVPDDLAGGMTAGARSVVIDGQPAPTGTSTTRSPRACSFALAPETPDRSAIATVTVPSAWSSDRLHLNSRSHRLIAERAAVTLGLPPAGTGAADSTGGAGADAPPPIVWTPAAAEARQAGRAAWLAARREDYQWARESFVPWIGRRILGTSSGDGRSAKRPDLLPVLPPSPPGHSG